MRALQILALIAVVALAGLAPALAQDSDLPERTPRHVRRAKAYVIRGREHIGRAQKKESETGRIKAYDRALLFLRRARMFTGLDTHPELRKLDKEAGKLLADAARAQAKLYVRRKSLPLARKRAKEALTIDRADAEALALLELIEAALEGRSRTTDLEDADLSSRAASARYRSAVPLTGRAAGRSQ